MLPTRCWCPSRVGAMGLSTPWSCACRLASSSASRPPRSPRLQLQLVRRHMMSHTASRGSSSPGPVSQLYVQRPVPARCRAATPGTGRARCQLMVQLPPGGSSTVVQGVRDGSCREPRAACVTQDCIVRQAALLNTRKPHVELAAHCWPITSSHASLLRSRPKHQKRSKRVQEWPADGPGRPQKRRGPAGPAAGRSGGNRVFQIGKRSDSGAAGAWQDEHMRWVRITCLLNMRLLLLQSL